MSKSTIAERIKSVGRKSKAPHLDLDAEEAYRRGLGVASVGMDDLILHEEAIRRGEIPQELRDKGIVSIKYVDKAEQRKEWFNDKMNNMRNIFSRTKENIHEQSTNQEYVNESEPGDDIGTDMEQGDTASSMSYEDELATMTDEALYEKTGSLDRGDSQPRHQSVRERFRGTGVGYEMRQEMEQRIVEQRHEQYNMDTGDVQAQTQAQVGGLTKEDLSASPNKQERTGEVRQSMEEYKEAWVERFAQTNSSDERKNLMDELNERRNLQEYEEEFVDNFIRERDPDKRQELVDALRNKQAVFDTSVDEQTIHDPGTEFDSMTDERKEELGYHPRAEYRTMAPHVREKWDAKFQSQHVDISEGISLSNNDLADLNVGASQEMGVQSESRSIQASSVQLSTADIDDLSTPQPSHQL